MKSFFICNTIMPAKSMNSDSLKVKMKLLCHIQLIATPWDCSSQNSPGKNTGVGSLSLLQVIVPPQGSTPGLLPCRWILYQLSHQGSPRILEWSLSLLQGIFLTQELKWALLHFRWILYQLSYQGSPD